MDKRRFLGAMMAAAASGAAPARAQGADALGRRGESAPARIPRRTARTTRMFLTPPCWPNAIAVEPGRGFWVQEQRHDNAPEKAWLLDFNTGKVLHTVTTNCKDTSGMAFGDGFLWSGANGASIKNHPIPPINGIFQTDMNSRQVSWRQIPFGPKEDGGATHGLAWDNGKLWIHANRLDAIIRVDPGTWQTDWMVPVAKGISRLHGIAYDKGYLWQVCGTQKPGTIGYEGYTPGLVKYDVQSAKVVEIVDFVPGSCDIHDVTVRDGQLYGVDAGEHPGWPVEARYAQPGFPELNSPSGGYVFRIDLI